MALSVLLLAGCCALSWGAASAIFPSPGGPIAAASTAVSGLVSASATATATDQPTATDDGTPISGGDATPTTTPGGDGTPTSSPSASPTDTPTATPISSPQPTPTATPCPDPYNNPWGYNFCPGSLISRPPNPAFCSVFPCIGTPPNYLTFWSQTGYVVQCQDGLFAKDGNPTLIGTCKKNGGYQQTLYQHP